MGILAEQRALSPKVQQSVAEEHRLLAEQVDLAASEIDTFFSTPANRSPADVQRLVHLSGELIETAEAHFFHEEALMKKDGYPGLFFHKRDHENLLKKLNRFVSSLARAGVAASAGSGVDLHSWLTSHTKKFDEPYAAFVESHTRDPGD